MQKDLSIAQRRLGESVLQHTALASMHTDSRAAPSIDCLDIAGPHFVVVALPDVASCSEDLLERGRRVEDDAVGTISELRAWVACQSEALVVDECANIPYCCCRLYSQMCLSPVRVCHHEGKTVKRAHSGHGNAASG
jgi:hypothetical protein